MLAFGENMNIFVCKRAGNGVNGHGVAENMRATAPCQLENQDHDVFNCLGGVGKNTETNPQNFSTMRHGTLKKR